MTSNNANPIAVIDSGIGGISTLSFISKTLPHENIIYVADSYYAPYGGKSDQEITSRMLRIFDFLLTKNSKLFVLACNTATAASIAKLRHIYPYPIIGMEPALKPASLITKNNEVGVLATAGTLKSAKFAALLDKQSHGDINFYTQPCNGLVEYIENGDTNSEELKKLLIGYLKPLLEKNIDTLVLGCTHYWFIKELIEEIIGKQIIIIDTNQAVANQVNKTLINFNLCNKNTPGHIEFWSNSKNKNAKEIISKYWKRNNYSFFIFE